MALPPVQRALLVVGAAPVSNMRSDCTTPAHVSAGQAGGSHHSWTSVTWGTWMNRAWALCGGHVCVWCIQTHSGCQRGAPSSIRSAAGRHQSGTRRAQPYCSHVGVLQLLIAAVARVRTNERECPVNNGARQLQEPLVVALGH
jgi:hypothetical protein